MPRRTARRIGKRVEPVEGQEPVADDVVIERKLDLLMARQIVAGHSLQKRLGKGRVGNGNIDAEAIELIVRLADVAQIEPEPVGNHPVRPS